MSLTRAPQDTRTPSSCCSPLHEARAGVDASKRVLGFAPGAGGTQCEKEAREPRGEVRRGVAGEAGSGSSLLVGGKC